MQKVPSHKLVTNAYFQQQKGANVDSIQNLQTSGQKIVRKSTVVSKLMDYASFLMPFEQEDSNQI